MCAVELCVQVAILTDRRVAHVVPWSATVEAELLAAGVPKAVPEEANGDDWLIVLVVRGAATVTERAVSPTAPKETSKDKWQQAVSSRYPGHGPAAAAAHDSVCIAES